MVFASHFSGCDALEEGGVATEIASVIAERICPQGALTGVMHARKWDFHCIEESDPDVDDEKDASKRNAR